MTRVFSVAHLIQHIGWQNNGETHESWDSVFLHVELQSELHFDDCISTAAACPCVL